MLLARFLSSMADGLQGSPATGKVMAASYRVLALLKPVSSYPFSDGELLL